MRCDQDDATLGRRDVAGLGQKGVLARNVRVVRGVNRVSGADDVVGVGERRPGVAGARLEELEVVRALDDVERRRRPDIVTVPTAEGPADRENAVSGAHPAPYVRAGL